MVKIKVNIAIFFVNLMAYCAFSRPIYSVNGRPSLNSYQNQLTFGHQQAKIVPKHSNTQPKWLKDRLKSKSRLQLMQKLYRSQANIQRDFWIEKALEKNLMHQKNNLNN